MAAVNVFYDCAQRVERVEETFEYGQTIDARSAMARDDDGIQAVLCSVDGGATVEYGTDGVFRQEIEGLADGAHSVTALAPEEF